MFYVLQEDRKFLIELWNDIVNSEDIDPYSELNIDLIENYDRFSMPDTDIPLLFIDDEYGLCGCAVLTPLEISRNHPDMLGHNAKWMLHAVNMFLRKSPIVALHTSKIEAIKIKFYTQLRRAVCELLESEELEGSRGLFVLSEDLMSQNEFQQYTRFVIGYETDELDHKGNIIRVIPDIRLFLNETHIPKSTINSSRNNVVFFRSAHM